MAAGTALGVMVFQLYHGVVLFQIAADDTLLTEHTSSNADIFSQARTDTNAIPNSLWLWYDMQK